MDLAVPLRPDGGLKGVNFKLGHDNIKRALIFKVRHIQHLGYPGGKLWVFTVWYLKIPQQFCQQCAPI